MNTAKDIESNLQIILNRSLAEGGFNLFDKNSLGVEATTWAILALKSCGGFSDIVLSSCHQLSAMQLANGSLTEIDSNSGAHWPTYLAILAWSTVEGFEKELNKAIQFLLTISGKISFKKDSALFAHDPSLKGWSWTDNTSPWIEPTTMAILALKANGYGDHERVSEGIRMILNRQLVDGGWNYGNTLVFGKKLMPIPEYTGKALCALSGNTEINSVKRSINYLFRVIKTIRTPHTLSWSIFGLRAWSMILPKFGDCVLESLALQSRYGKYDTVALSQLLSVYFTSGDFFRLFLN